MNGTREITKKSIGYENKNEKAIIGKTKIDVDRPNKEGEKRRMDNNHERRMLGGQRRLEEAKSDDPYDTWKHPIKEDIFVKLRKEYFTLYCY